MEINECKHKAKCDFLGCNNFAQYSFSTKGVLRRDLSFCGECLKGMYQAIGRMQTPKGLESPYKINKRKRRENE